MAFRKDNNKNTNFSRISIGLASPEEIKDNSKGEVLKPETINYRTYKPERDGLFCERIFGPVKDYECGCGKYKRIRYKGTTCDRCGVEVTEKKVRRERCGHIELVVPVAHIWYFRSLPNKIGYLLGMPTKKLDAVIYYERYVVLQPGPLAKSDGLQKLDTLGEDEYLAYCDKLSEKNLALPDSDPNKFIAKMGAEAILQLLQEVDLDTLAYELRDKANQEGSAQRKAEALKRLQVVEQFRVSKECNKPEWMIMKILPVIPPEIRPLVPLDGGRFATSDVNDLYRRVIIRNNRLKRLLEIKAPDVILRNEKRMLQEAVDSLFDNSRKSSAVKSEANRPLKSLSDSLKGKQGRFRQNLLGKRVDYSARSVIVVGPELKMNECGLPKLMAAELYKPFVIRKLIERGIVKTVKSAKKIVDKRDPIVWDILELVMKGHPVLLNRAPTLHRLGIQAFQPKMIEGKAIQLHPLACTAFNADFDGDQMAVHLPLGNAAILEAQILMLGSHNILNPANGAPITVPSQDMVLGLYYITKVRNNALGEGSTFYGPEEAMIAYNEGKCSMHAKIKCVVDDIDHENGSKPIRHMVETSVGRLIFNEKVPQKVGFVNEVITKKSLRNVITDVIKFCGIPQTAEFLDDVKNLGYFQAFRAGLSFNLGDVLVPTEKSSIIAKGEEEVDAIMDDYNNGWITNNERYNKVVDVWSAVNKNLTDVLMKQFKEAEQGFNAIYMMMDSGARGSKDQIAQLSGMRGLMAKPQKAGAEGAQIIENPIKANFKEGMTALEYFISTHGARKGLADTALKTADAGYLTRRLVDVAHDVIIREEDCGTLRGLICTELKNNDEVVATLKERILGRVTVQDIIHPLTGELIIASGEEITERIADIIEESPIEQVEIRSVLTCESKHGVCAKCYGRNLSTNRMVQKGEAVGVIAAQSIGEPGTQLTLRTFHAGGIASNAVAISNLKAAHDGIITIDELRTIDAPNDNGTVDKIVVSRMTEMHIDDPHTGITIMTASIGYGSKLFVESGQMVKKGDVIAEWDPFNAVIVSQVGGKVRFKDVVAGVTFTAEIDGDTGLEERIVIDAKDRTMAPEAQILDAENVDELGEPILLATYSLPVGSHIMINDGEIIKPGEIVVKIQRQSSKAGDITGGLPRVTELFEARNPSNPAVVSEIDGEITLGKIRRGNREVIVTGKYGDERKYLIPLSRQMLVQEHDYVRAGNPLTDGAITPGDILRILGPTKVQEYIVNQVQDVYRLQGVKINDKHFEIIVRQMMRKVMVLNPGDTRFLENQLVDKLELIAENDRIWGMKYITKSGESEVLKPGMIVTARRIRDENALIKRKEKKCADARDAMPATCDQVLQGITRAALGTTSFMSAASFQETTRVLNEAAILGKTDYLEGMKENVICGHLIPAGTGQRDFKNLYVGSRDEFNRAYTAPRRVLDFD